MRGPAIFRPNVRSMTLTARLLLLLLPSMAAAATIPGRRPDDGGGRGEVKIEPNLSLATAYTTTGPVTLSVDGLGTSSRSGLVQVQKPAGARVRVAYLAAATTGFTNALIPDGALTLNAHPVSWNRTLFNTIGSRNHLADVSALLAPALDAAAPGLIDVVVDEGANSHLIDGSILAVVWEDPAQTEVRTVSLFFGAQDVNGDAFNIGLAEPARPGDPDYVLDLALGISFGFQDAITRDQISRVEVNGTRLSSSAGGQDDGEPSNGALLTVGGLGDSREAPADPNGPPTDFDYDDELYDLKPLLKDETQLIRVTTVNPSRDDNIFFAALVVSGVAVVNEGIALAPAAGSALVGQSQSVTALVQNGDGARLPGRTVTFFVTAGPDSGLMIDQVTDGTGEAVLELPGASPGEDEIRACFVNSSGVIVGSNRVTRTWVQGDACAECPPPVAPEAVAGHPFALDFPFCNCALVADALAWSVTDEMGWLTVTEGSARLEPGACASAPVSGVVPMKLAAADTNRFTFVVWSLSAPTRRDRCVVHLPVRPPTLAVILTRFDARVEAGGVRVRWETAEASQSTYFDLYRADVDRGGFARINAAPLAGNRFGEFFDTGAPVGARCRYRLVSVDRQGFQDVAGETEAIATDGVAPPATLLCYPNPFATQATVTLELAEPAATLVRVFDTAGRRVRTLHNGPLAAGTARLLWDGATEAGRPAPAGLYFVRVDAAGVRRTLRIVRTPRSSTPH